MNARASLTEQRTAYNESSLIRSHTSPLRKARHLWVMPPGTLTSMTIVQLHHDENVFPDSQTFKPKRWINDPGLIKY